MRASPAELPFQTVQYRFAAYIRQPDSNPLPRGVEERRMQIYARLFYNNIESFIAKTFPVFREITEDRAWHRLVRAFVAGHRAESPYFSQISEEFLEYLDGYMRAPGDVSVPPFALELCHYEWVEMALDLAPDADCRFDDEPVDLDDSLMTSPLAWPLRYTFPVRQIGPDFQPVDAPEKPTWLIAWRNRHDQVRFMESNAVTVRLLRLIDEGSTIRSAFDAVAAEIGVAREQVMETGLATLNKLHAHDIVVRR